MPDTRRLIPPLSGTGPATCYGINLTDPAPAGLPRLRLGFEESVGGCRSGQVRLGPLLSRSFTARGSTVVDTESGGRHI